MASTDARPIPKKGVAYRHYFAIRKNDGTLITTWAGMDSELSKDGGDFADATNEATEIQTSGCGFIDLTAAETDYDCVTLKVTVSNTGALPYVVNLFPEEAGDIRVDTVQLGGTTQTARDLGDSVLVGDKTGFALSSAYDPAKSAAAAADMATALSSLTTLLTRLSAARAGYIDNLNVGGLLASQADVAAITQAQRVRIAFPMAIERPDADSTTYRLYVYSYNEQHTAEDLDSNPTVTAENNIGTDRSGNLGTVTKAAGTGIYYVDYTVASTHAIEGLLFKVTATEGSTATQYAAASLVVDTTAVDFTSADRSKLEGIYGKLPSNNIADQTTLAALHNIQASDVVTALKASTGWTAGGTATLATVIKWMLAMLGVKVIDKAGVPGTVQMLDGENKLTVVAEVALSETTPYTEATFQ